MPPKNAGLQKKQSGDDQEFDIAVDNRAENREAERQGERREDELSSFRPVPLQA
ncbi:MAG: hypothetical protein ABSA10_08130 [Anaerolineales bacterium]